jgi:SAM-dependent methyltransferase
MDNTSKKIMQSFVDKYLEDRELSILDVGSLNVNGTYGKCFNNPKWKYTGADIIAGPNVDVVIRYPYIWREFKDNTFDVVISGQTFEHIEFPWLTIKEIERVMKPGGIGCIIVPSSGYEHGYPIDCWRFMPDGLRALCNWAGLELLEINKNEEGIWKLTTIIFKKMAKDIKFNDFVLTQEKTRRGPIEIPGAVRTDLPKFLKEQGLIKGVEVGVQQGIFLEKLCEAGLEVTGIDPWLAYGDYNEEKVDFQKVNDDFYNETINRVKKYPKCKILRKTSMEALKDFPDYSLDFVYIDGHHGFKYAAEDIYEWSKKVRKGGILCGHDYGTFGRRRRSPYACKW